MPAYRKLVLVLVAHPITHQPIVITPWPPQESKMLPRCNKSKLNPALDSSVDSSVDSFQNQSTVGGKSKGKQGKEGREKEGVSPRQPHQDQSRQKTKGTKSPDISDT